MRFTHSILTLQLTLALGCRRVALGWRVDGRVRVVGLSHGAQLAEHPVLGGVAEAMHEAMGQGLTLCVPRVADGAVRIPLAQRALITKLLALMSMRTSTTARRPAAKAVQRLAPDSVRATPMPSAASACTRMISRRIQRALMASGERRRRTPRQYCGQAARQARRQAVDAQLRIGADRGREQRVSTSGNARGTPAARGNGARVSHPAGRGAGRSRAPTSCARR